MEAFSLLQCIIMEKHSNQINTMMKQRKRLTTELKKTPSWATVGPATDKHQTPTHQLKLYVRAVIKSKAWPTVVQLERNS